MGVLRNVGIVMGPLLLFAGILWRSPSISDDPEDGFGRGLRSAGTPTAVVGGVLLLLALGVFLCLTTKVQTY